MTEIAIKERPILFSGPMILALLAGKKTQTRRAMKPQPVEDNGLLWWHYSKNEGTANNEAGQPAKSWLQKCPYGQVGDRLWVRETLFWSTCDDGWCYQAGNDPVMLETYTAPILLKEKPAIPSIHMPREASRILLEITDVRVERLNDISEADAIAEGIEQTEDWGGNWKWYQDYLSEPNQLQARESYASLWKKINGLDSWNKNPWVWVVCFRRIEPVGA